MISLVLLASSVALPRFQGNERPHHPALIATLADPAVSESSGLVASLRTPGLLWTINDSGNPPTLFATNRAGDALATVPVPGATNIDWEEIATAVTGDGNTLLYLADTGDNRRTRAEIAIYRVPEPEIELDGVSPAARHETALAQRFPLVLPDGARDIEAMLVQPITGEMLLVSKEAVGAAAVYQVPPLIAPEEPLVVTRRDDLALPGFGPFRAVTGGAIAATGDQVALRSATAAYLWRLPAGIAVRAILTEPPQRVELPPMPAGEAITFSAGGESLFLTSEGTPCPLYEIALAPHAA